MKKCFVTHNHTDLQQALGPRPELLTGHSGVKYFALGLPEPQLVLLHTGVHLFQSFRSWALTDHNIQLYMSVCVSVFKKQKKVPHTPFSFSEDTNDPKL